MSKVIPLPNSLGRIEKTIRETAFDSENIFITKHVEQRMTERKITMTQVLRCLRYGEFIEGPVTCSEKQIGWKAQMRHCCAGQFIHVVVKLIEERGDYLLLITTFRK